MAFSLSSCAQSGITLQGPAGESVRIQVEVADDPAERRQGLMHREELPEGTGMLFVVEQERPLSFWMKNTLIPLDILFFDDEGAFISHESMQPCEEEPCPRYQSQAPGKYALEVPLGTAESLNIRQGWRLLLE